MLFIFLVFVFFFLMIRRPPRSTLFPTRRSSDLANAWQMSPRSPRSVLRSRHGRAETYRRDHRRDDGREDRKSTRLNSSHQIISYAVFCLKKKKKEQKHTEKQQSTTDTQRSKKS